MKALVVGGGIVGAACAYELARRGASVEIVDAGTPPVGASVRSDGGLLLGNKRPESVPLARAALHAWDALVGSLGEVEYEPNRLLMVAQDERQAASLEDRVAALRDAGVAVVELSGAECRSLDAGLSPSVCYGMQVPENRALQPMLATVALLRLARSAGAVVRADTEVTAVEPSRVHTVDGCLDADEVIVAAGAWTGQLMARSGFHVPVEPRRGHVLVAERRAARVVRCGAMGAAYADVAHSADAGLHSVPLVTGTRSGTVLIGATRERVGFEQRVDVGAVRRMCAGAVGLYPALRDCRVIRSWIGFRPWTPDGHPYVGRLAPGLNVAAGHEGEGITYGPLTGQLVARALLDGVPVPVAWDAGRLMTERQRDGACA